MSIKAFVLGYDNGGAGISISCLLLDSTGVDTGCIGPVITVNNGDTLPIIQSQVESTINGYCTANGIGLPTSFTWLTPSGMANAPQAAIANAPADAVTNYNTVTTLLGAVTGAVNDANTKQNQIATKLNSLLSELRTLGLIAS